MLHLRNFIQKLLDENGKTWDELELYIKKNCKDSRMKFDYANPTFWLRIPVTMLDTIADFFDCDLSIDFILDSDTKYHCNTIREEQWDTDMALGEYYNSFIDLDKSDVNI